MKNNFKYYICDYIIISKRIVDGKETRKDSRKYFVLRKLVRESFERIVVEDIDYVIQEKLDDLFMLAVILDVSIVLYCNS